MPTLPHSQLVQDQVIDVRAASASTCVYRQASGRWHLSENGRTDYLPGGEEMVWNVSTAWSGQRPPHAFLGGLGMAFG